MIDHFIIDILNTLAHDFVFLTKIMHLIVDNSLLKGGVIMALVWYLWFSSQDSNSETRGKIITTLFTMVIAITIGRGLAILLPYKARPILNSEFDFAYKIDSYSWLNTWSSFPSDHAILFFSLVTGIFLVSKKWGLFSSIYVLVVICLPRIYLGFHYPSDIFFGAIIGIIIALAVFYLNIFNRLCDKILEISKRFPGIFYTCFFILSYQTSTLFHESRRLISALFRHLFL